MGKELFFTGSLACGMVSLSIAGVLAATMPVVALVVGGVSIVVAAILFYLGITAYFSELKREREAQLEESKENLNRLCQVLLDGISDRKTEKLLSELKTLIEKNDAPK